MGKRRHSRKGCGCPHRRKRRSSKSRRTRRRRHTRHTRRTQRGGNLGGVVREALTPLALFGLTKWYQGNKRNGKKYKKKSRRRR